MNMILKIYLLLKNVQAKCILLFKKNNKLISIFLGIVALVWFLIRVIPKPQRANYPCQRAAFPIASAFVIWIIGVFSSKVIFGKAQRAFSNKKIIRSTILMALAIGIFLSSVMFSSIFESAASELNSMKLKKGGEELYQKHNDAITKNIVEPDAYVGIVQSDKASAYDIDFNELDQMIREAVSLAGGFDTLINEGDTVVLKPNVISARTEVGVELPDTANGVATDYRTLQIVANMVRERNATGKIFIIEASGNGVTRSNIEELGYYNVTGIDSIILLDEFTGAWYDTSDPELVEVNLPSGKNLYPAGNKYYLNKIYKNAQVVISLPCLKTHALTGITGGVKNVGIGATPVQVYGLGPNEPEAYRAARWGRIDHGFGSSPTPLHQWIHDYYMCRPVDYVIMDGLQGIEYGPYPGGMTGANVALSSVQKNIRIMLAGQDALAVDAIHALIAGVDPYLVGHLQFLAKDNMGCINPALIKVKGTKVHQVKTRLNEANPGRNAQYSDFEEPKVEVPEPCSITNNVLNIALLPDDEVVKIEVAYDDTIKSSIVIDGFESISIPMEYYQTDISKVKVMAYDRYLNCNTFTPDRIIVSSKQKALDKLKVYPVPATNYLTIDCDKFTGVTTIDIYSTSGKKVMHETLIKNTTRINISSLPTGNYIIIGKSGNKKYTSKFQKI